MTTHPTSDPVKDDAPISTAKSHQKDGAYGSHLYSEAGDALVERSVTIDRPRDELYRFWRDFRNLPLFMHNIRSVGIIDSERSHWVVAAPAGKTVEWDAVITEEQPGELIAWRSEESASLRNSGTVEFKDSREGRGTVVTVTLTYDPPGGALGQLIAKLYHKEPKIQARRDLRRFKQLMETGEVSNTTPPDASPRA